MNRPVGPSASIARRTLDDRGIADHGRLLSFEVVEINPVIDERNRTAELAVELTCSAFGKKIL